MENKFITINADVKLSYSENFLVEWIENNVDFFLFNTINNIAKKANVSTSLITKTLKKLGHKNLSQFKLKVNSQIALIENSYKYQTTDDPIFNSIEYIRSHNLFAIHETLSELKIENIKLIVDAIEKASNIIVYGVGSSGTACEEFMHNFRKIGKNAIYNADFHNILLELPLLTNNDLIILFSKSLATLEVKTILKFAKTKNIPIGLITAAQNHLIKENANYAIEYKSVRQQNRISAISSKTIQLIIADIIYSSYIYSHPELMKYIQEGTNLINAWNGLK